MGSKRDQSWGDQAKKVKRTEPIGTKRWVCDFYNVNKH